MFVKRYIFGDIVVQFKNYLQTVMSKVEANLSYKEAPFI